MNSHASVRHTGRSEPRTTAHGTVLRSRAEALERAAAIVPTLRARAAQTEADRRVSDDVINALRASGLFGLLTPKIFGGAELGLASLLEVTATLASGCASTGWVFGVLSGHHWVLGLFDPAAQREVFAVKGALVATVLRLGGNPPQKTEGGYHFQGGTGRFCSGIDHADWLMVGAAVDEGNGAPEARYFLVPTRDVEVIDDWFTAGMRGTGSRSIRIADAFVPEHRTVAFNDLLRGTTPGGRFHASPLYRLPFKETLPLSFAGAPIGAARAARDAFIASTKAKLDGAGDEQVAEQSATFARIAQAAADIDAAFSLLMEDASQLDSASDASDLSPIWRARIARDFAYAAQKCRHAATSLFEAAGGSGIYDTSELQRIWRDVNAAASHLAFTWDTAATGFGRALLGLAPSKFDRRGH